LQPKLYYKFYRKDLSDMKKMMALAAGFFSAALAFAQPAGSESIMGSGSMTAEQLQGFFVRYNPDGDIERAARLAELYIEEADAEGVNHDIAFAQMILETGWLSFTGLVRPEMNNFCGIGATGGTKIGHIFDSERDGVRAHVQHLKAYASADLPVNPIIDPRYNLVSPKGKSPTIGGLAGTWAADMAYANKIRALLEKMHQFNGQWIIDNEQFNHSQNERYTSNVPL
jgi:hypothetical protein